MTNRDPKLVTRRDRIKHWINIYSTEGSSPLPERTERFRALDPETATDREVDWAYSPDNNWGLTELICDCCRRDVDVVAAFPEYEAEDEEVAAIKVTPQLCGDCARAASRLFDLDDLEFERKT